MRKHCAHCQQMFNAERRTRRFCSKRCSAQSRPSDFYRGIGLKAAETRYPDRYTAMRNAFERWAKDLDPWRAFQVGAIWQKKRSSVTGYSRARRAGYAEGYLAGIQAERRQARYEAVMGKDSMTGRPVAIPALGGGVRMKKGKDSGGTRLTEGAGVSVLVPADQLPHDARMA
jgi:hypothetical protein